MLPSREEEVGGGYDVDNNVYSGFLIPGESRVFGLKKIPKEFRESCCIGSSNGWRVFLKLETTEPFLFQPFRQEKIRLPPLHGQVDILRIEGKAERDIEIEIDFGIYKDCPYKHQLRLYFLKAIVMEEPDGNNTEFVVILLRNDGKSIAL
ncbi:hypothetical protein QUC31_016399 [Theobroma cacao]